MLVLRNNSILRCLIPSWEAQVGAFQRSVVGWLFLWRSLLVSLNFPYSCEPSLSCLFSLIVRLGSWIGSGIFFISSSLHQMAAEDRCFHLWPWGKTHGGELQIRRTAIFLQESSYRSWSLGRRLGAASRSVLSSTSPPHNGCPFYRHFPRRNKYLESAWMKTLSTTTSL
jgi:hypothetical protein